LASIGRDADSYFKNIFIEVIKIASKISNKKVNMNINNLDDY
jgi:hypothetical protein